MLKNISKERVGNILLYLASKIKDLSLTKTLKLLYLIDETAVRETGVPVTWLEYKVWKLGPVPEPIYDELSNTSESKIILDLTSFINIERRNLTIDGVLKECTFISPSSDFSEDIFSEYELELFDKVIETFGSLTSEQIIDILHSEGSLWDKKVKEENLIKLFEIQNGKSDISILFTDLLNDALKKVTYQSAFEMQSF